MKKILIILTATLLITLTAKGQNLFFVGENSFTCTETITLQANSDDVGNLNVQVGKEGAAGIIAVSVKYILPALFGEELIIYLADGIVITCNTGVGTEYVDDNAKAVYYLTSDQLNKMKNSNVHTVRYTLENDVGTWLYSATNKGTSTSNIITKFFRE